MVRNIIRYCTVNLLFFSFHENCSEISASKESIKAILNVKNYNNKIKDWTGQYSFHFGEFSWVISTIKKSQFLQSFMHIALIFGRFPGNTYTK